MVIYNEGTQLLGRRQSRHRPVRRQHRRLADGRGQVARGQEAFRRLKYAPFPVVAAPSGMALGGGCEFCLHCDAIQAHAETYIGLVEVGVGRGPGLGRLQGAADAAGCSIRSAAAGRCRRSARCSRPSAWPQVAKSAAEAQGTCWSLRDGDGITMNRDRLLADAKAKALAPGRRATRHRHRSELPCPGRTGASRWTLAVDDFPAMGNATAHDVVVVYELAKVLSAATPTSPSRSAKTSCSRLSAQAFMEPASSIRATLARMEHMLETGKPFEELITVAMTTYSAPLRDMRFVFHELFGGEPLQQLRGYEEVTPDLVDAVLEEGGKFCRERARPAQQHRGREGCRLRERRGAHAHRVSGSLRPFAEGGWSALSCAPQYGGQGLPNAFTWRSTR